MTSSETLSGDLSELQHRQRERSLTVHHASQAPHLHVLGNPRLESAGGGCIDPHTISVRRDRMTGDGAIHELIALVSLLGLEPDAPARRLRIVDPRLPPHIDRLSLSGVRVGEAIADLSFLRTSDNNVAVSWLVRRGPLIVEVCPRAEC